jgi:hypothetical protein
VLGDGSQENTQKGRIKENTQKGRVLLLGCCSGEAASPGREKGGAYSTVEDSDFDKIIKNCYASYSFGCGKNFLYFLYFLYSVAFNAEIGFCVIKFQK